VRVCKQERKKKWRGSDLQAQFSAELCPRGVVAVVVFVPGCRR